MKILVINNLLEEKHIELIKAAAEKAGAAVSFYKTEQEIPQSDFDADIIYGFAPSIVKTSKNLKWLCVPWAGVDSIMVPDYFANDDCLLTNSAGAYGVSIAEHMIAVSRRLYFLPVYLRELKSKVRLPNRQLKLLPSRL